MVAEMTAGNAFRSVRPGIADYDIVKVLDRVRGGRDGTADWKNILEQGLPHALYVFPLARWERMRWRATERRLLTAYGLGGVLVQLLKQNAKAVDHAALSQGVDALKLRDVEKLAGSDNALEVRAGIELLLFRTVRWRLRWCEHGRHFYIGDARSRKACPAHTEAGRQARYLARDPDRYKRKLQATQRFRTTSALGKRRRRAEGNRYDRRGV